MKIEYGSHLFHITDVKNLPSISQSGFLFCKKTLSQRLLEPVDISHTNIQNERSSERIPCAMEGTLHDYVPFHFAPRSPMLCAIHT